jgi:dipeptidyl aminopeptidase/acylaminoacyl peptidase
MFPWSITGDGQTVIAVVSDVVAPIRVVPVAGGPSRSLTQAREYDDLDSWSTDATRLSVATRTNGHSTLLDLPVDGSPGVEVASPPGSSGRMLSPDRKHLFYVVGDSTTKPRSLWVRRLSDGRTREIARDLAAPSQFSTHGPGGVRFSGEEVLYFGRRGDRLELRACAPEGEPRVLRSFPLDLSAVGINSGVGVHGERVAWTEVFGDSSALLVAEGRNGTPRRVAVAKGSLRFPVWSPDGRWIAVNSPPQASGGSSRYAVLVVGVASGGQPGAPPRFIDAGTPSGWSIRWMPDSRAVTVLGSVGGSTTDIWLVSLRDGDRPVNLTRDDSSTMWNYSLSPDGKYIAYPAEIPRGSSIWRIDLGR